MSTLILQQVIKIIPPQIYHFYLYLSQHPPHRTCHLGNAAENTGTVRTARDSHYCCVAAAAAYFSRAHTRQSSRASHLHACEGWGERAARREKGETTTWTTVAWLLLSGQPEPYDRFRVSSEETGRRKGEQTEPGYCLRIVHFR